mmetsp:Transcript_470/g.1094  ORF Transcript_470/g.1094 Transcript_470/m.1094 type:complete len:714 (+) Transcript_470:262-2403(+)
MVLRLPPLRHSRAVEKDDREVGVQQEDAVRLQGRHVQEHRLGRPVERVRGDLRLDHHHRVAHALLEQHQPEVGGLVRAVVEDLHKLRAAQVEHELRVVAQLRHELEARGVVLAVVAEAPRQADEAAVQPARRVELVLCLHLEGAQPRHRHGSSLLVKARHEVAVGIAVGPSPGDGRHAHAHGGVPVLVAGDELQEELLVGGGAGGLVVVLVVGDDVKVDGQRGCLHHGGQLPHGGAAQADGDVAHGGGFLLRGGGAAQQARNLDIPGAQHLKGGVGRHAQEARVARLGKHPLERLAEDAVAEGVGLHDEAAGALHRGLHLREAHLVQRARKDVQPGAVRHQLRAHLVVVLQRLAVEGGRLLGEVLVRADGLLQLLVHHLARALRGRAAQEEHEARQRHAARDAGGDERGGHLQRGAGAAREAVLRHAGERVHLQLLQHAVQLELALRKGQDEAPPRRLLLLRVAALPAGAQAQRVLHHLRLVLLGALEHVGARDLLAAQLVHVHVRAKGDKPHVRLLRDDLQRLRDGCLGDVQLVLRHAGVQNKDVDRRVRGDGARKGVLHGAIVGEQLRGQVVLVDGGVVRGEVVARVAEGADPDLGGEVHARVRVQHGAAALAGHRLVGHHRQVRQLLVWAVHRREGHHALGRLQLAVRPDVPRHPDAVPLLQLAEVRHRGVAGGCVLEAPESRLPRARCGCCELGAGASASTRGACGLWM